MHSKPPGRRRDDRVVLPNGLRVHGASKFEARYQHFIRDYFQPGFEFRPGMTLLDVGANIGMFSLEILRRCAGDVDLFAFEPAHQTFAHLERNIRELFPDARARLFRCAIAADSAQATFYYRPRASGLSSLHREAPDHDSQAVLDSLLRGDREADPPPEYRDGFLQALFRRLPYKVAQRVLGLAARWSMAEVVETQCSVITLSEILGEHAIECVDFLKIDVEGAELDVLRGIEPQDWPKIQRLAVEVDNLGGNLQAIRELLERAGFGELQMTQQWPFEGTHVWMLHASRPAPAPDAAQSLQSTSRR